MIEISCQNIQFFSDERIKTFQVTNKGQVGLLFKIKTNNTKVLDARPNTGLIAPGAQSKITVKRAEEVANNLKLQISSIECKEELTNENFRELWTKYEKNQVSNTLAVKIVEREQGNKVEASDDPQTEHESNVFRSVINNEEKSIKHETENESVFETKPRPVQESGTQEIREANSEKGKEHIFENERIVKSKMSEKMEENEILKKKLAEKEKEIENLNKNSASKGNSLSQKNTQSGNNKITVLITALIFFILGYYIGGGGNEKVELNVEKRLGEENLHVNKSIDL